MSSTIISSTIEIIENSYVDFHIKGEDEVKSEFLKPFGDEDQKFGTLSIKINDTPMISSPQYILFMLDRSQSMTDSCGDTLTKMEHALHTIKNIVKLIVNSNEKCPPVYVQVFTFDDEVEEVIPKIQVTKDNMEEINIKINSIEPRNSTNIEAALRKSREIFEELSDDVSETKTHIFLTDGMPTDGERNITRLIKKELPVLYCTPGSRLV